MTDTKLPPYNLEAEENVLGSLLIDGSLIQGLALEPGDFYSERGSLVYAACKALGDRGVSVNQITLAQELNDRGNLETVGGAAYLSHLISACVSSLDCTYYADIVKRLSIYRSMIIAADKIAALGYGQGPDVSKALSSADDILLSLRKNGMAESVITPEQRAKLMIERYEALNKADSGVAVPTGLKDLDGQIGGGLYAGEMAVLAARPSVGKTTLIKNIADNNGSSGRKVLFCSAEMTVAGIGDRDIASLTGLTTNEIRRGGYTQDVYDKIVASILRVIERRVTIYHESPLTTGKIMQQGTNMQLRHGLDLIVVDYLGLLDDDYGNNQYERIAYVSRKLKQIAMKLNVPVLVAHQLNRALEAREDKRPHLSDLRDSGRIEEDADLVLFLYRDSYYANNVPDVAEILIAKQRQGDSHKTVRVFYDRQRQLYRNLTREDTVGD